ncbi:MAG: tRNA-guanine transglycosylase, partial [Solirubrobacterales bacterium]|nr:tRNA-guanine transglycosylase [Solirubrobacterales bacterium]
MRSDPTRLRFEVVARDGDARAGVLHTPHGSVATPCFVPLATRGSVKGMLPDEVSKVGYDMVLGNTYHLMLAPGAELIAELGG